MNDRSKNKAFTLVEILVALALIGLIVSMVYGSYAATTRTLDIYNSRMACGDRTHLVLRLLARQFRCAYMAPQQAGGTQTSASLPPFDDQQTQAQPRNTLSGPSSVAFRGDPRDPRGEILCLTTSGGFSRGPDQPGGLSRIRYRYEARGGRLSIRWGPCLGPSAPQRNSQAWRPVLDGITSIDLEFHDGRRWQPRWNSDETGRLPQAVRVVLTVADEGGRTHRYETAVPIACRSTIRTTLHGAPGGRP
jgi:prepilin-type N-terminal cleavage/methylation domain-containing protein